MGEGLTKAEVAELARAFATPLEARQLLMMAGFPLGRLPSSPGGADEFWEVVSGDLRRGMIADGRARLLAEASRRYPGNVVFRAAIVEAAERDSPVGDTDRKLPAGISVIGHRMEATLSPSTGHILSLPIDILSGLLEGLRVLTSRLWRFLRSTAGTILTALDLTAPPSPDPSQIMADLELMGRQVEQDLGANLQEFVHQNTDQRLSTPSTTTGEEQW